MNEQLATKILADLAKTGFDSEMRAIQACRAAGWSTSGSTGYYDRDAEITREIDFTAYKVLHRNGNDDQFLVDCTYHISAEVKKSDVPWVVFRAPAAPFRMTDAWQNLICASALPGPAADFYPVISRSSLAAELGWSGHGIHEAFKDPDKPSRWYKAFLSACKAAEAALTVNTEEGSPYTYFFFSKPVVILDGPLVVADLSDSGEVTVAETDAAHFEFSFE